MNRINEERNQNSNAYDMREVKKQIEKIESLKSYMRLNIISLNPNCWI